MAALVRTERKKKAVVMVHEYEQVLSLPLVDGGILAISLDVAGTKAIIMMVVCTGTTKINFFAKDPQALAGGTGII